MWENSRLIGWPVGACSPQPQKISIRPSGFCSRNRCTRSPPSSCGAGGGAWGVKRGRGEPPFRPGGGRWSAWGGPEADAFDPNCRLRLWAPPAGGPPDRPMLIIWLIDGRPPPAPIMPASPLVVEALTQ